MPRPLTVGLHPSLLPWGPEVKYALRVLLRVAGYPYRFVDSRAEADVDIYYGPRLDDCPRAVMYVAACGRPFTVATPAQPTAIRHERGMPFLEFGTWAGGIRDAGDGTFEVVNDIVFASFWTLTGARERAYPRDRHGGFRLQATVWARGELGLHPVVSRYGAWLREVFRVPAGCGLVPEWTSADGRAPVILSHTIDGTAVRRWAEAVGFAPAAQLSTRPTIYVVAHRRVSGRGHGASGSSTTGQPEIQRLAGSLRDAGCEIGLHASSGAHRDGERLVRERRQLEDMLQTRVAGVRHHPGCLDPAAPWETFQLHERSGFSYDSSLAFASLPGFRRGCCHPFRLFHPGERRELDLVELPPVWMVDDGSDPPARGHEGHDAARRLVDVVRATGGVAVLDYRLRGGSRRSVLPAGPWFEALQDQLRGAGTVSAVVEMYRAFERRLDAASSDETGPVRNTPRVPAANGSGARPGPVSVQDVDPATDARWDAYVQGRRDATIYHRAAWGAVTRAGLRHEARYLMAVDDTGVVRGVLPLFLVRGVFGRRLVSVPMRDRAGPLADDERALASLVAAAASLGRRLGCRSVMLRTLDPLPEYALPTGTTCLHGWVTTRIDLSPGVDALWTALDKDAVRWAIRKAGRNGFTVTRETEASAMRTFYALFIRAKRDLGIPPFPRAFFNAIHRHLIGTGHAELFVVRHGDRLVQGMVCFRSGDTFIPAYVAASPEARRGHANELLIWTTIRHAALEGFRTYDFGADSPLQEGLHWFKRKWGGVHHPMHAYQCLSNSPPTIGFDSSAPEYDVARAVWRRLPVPVCSVVGGWLTRQLS